MIGDKITIAGVEWEEVTADEFLELKWDKQMEINIMNKSICYKKVKQQVFPKVFDCFRVEKDGSISFKLSSTSIRWLHEDDIKALKQALAFKDKLLVKQNDL